MNQRGRCGRENQAGPTQQVQAAANLSLVRGGRMCGSMCPRSQSGGGGVAGCRGTGVVMSVHFHNDPSLQQRSWKVLLQARHTMLKMPLVMLCAVV